MRSVRRKLLSVLDAIDFSQDMPELLQLDFFERAQIEQVISNCEHVNEQGHTVCNVKVGFQDHHLLISRVVSTICLCLHDIPLCVYVFDLPLIYFFYLIFYSCCIECWLLR